MSATKNCIVCGQYGKRVKATTWCGWVLFLTDTRRDEVDAGFCRKHEDSAKSMPDKKHISRKEGCLGMWHPDYGWK